MISFLDLTGINKRFQEQFQSEFALLLDNSNYILGDKVDEFEVNFAAYCGAKYCVGTANGLDALTLILKGYIALGKLEKGDKVMVPANTFVATILSVLHADLVPVFVEPDLRTYNISPDEIQRHLTKDIKAIIAVHLYGQLANINEIANISNQNNLLLIADAAQAHGAENSNENKAGNLCDASAFSFYPSKNLGALGDGGAITTNDFELVKQVRLLRNYGSDHKYHNKVVGFNSRLDEIQAAFLNIKLKLLDSDNEKRREIASHYITSVNNPKITLPNYKGNKDHVFYAFVIRVDDRKDFIEFLEKNKIGSLIHYPIPPHKQDALAKYKNLYLPVTELIHNTVVSIPIGPNLKENEINTVIETLNAY